MLLTVAFSKHTYISHAPNMCRHFRCGCMFLCLICRSKKPFSALTIRNLDFSPAGMLGGWWFGGSPSSPDSNFLRVHNAFPPNRRLSDNQLIGPPKIRIAPSCASSPGGTPGSGGGLPIRRHSSIGPQERRGSAINLSPPTVRFFSTICTLIIYH
jgi:hypothetical protein